MDPGASAASGARALRLPWVAPFAWGRGAAVMGAEMVNTAVGWEIYRRTDSELMLGLVGAAVYGPVLLLIVPSGLAADRVPRRHLALAAQALLALASLGLLVATSLAAPVWALFTLLVLTGAGRALGRPAVGALLPQLVPAERLAGINTWLALTFQLGMVAGPVAAGLVIAAGDSAGPAFGLAALLQAGFAALLWRFPVIPPPPRPPGEPEGVRAMLDGLRFVWAEPRFLAAITLDLFAVLLGGAVALLPAYADDILHVDARGLGALRAAPGVGAIVMAVCLARLPPWTRPGRTLLVAVVGFGLSTIGFGLTTSFVLALLCLFLSGLFDAISVVIRMTLEQALTPDRLRGRVSAINYVFIGASNELGAFRSGAVAHVAGPVASVVGGGVGTLLVALGVALKWPQLRRIAPLHTLRPVDPERAGAPSRSV